MAEKGGRRGIVTGGTWCLDSNKTIAYWPPEDAVVPVLSVERLGGGSACNLGSDIKRLDADMPVETISLCGDDDAGRFLLAQADELGIDRRQFRVIAGATTSTTDAFCSLKSGRRTHIYEEGANPLLTPDHFDLARTRGRIFHLGLPGAHRRMDAPWGDDASGWVTVLRMAREAGLETNLEMMSISADRIAALAEPCLPFLDYLIVNDTEIGAIGGMQTIRDDATDQEACIAAARAVLQRGIMRMVVVHFTMGAIVVERNGLVHRKASVAVPAGENVGANGAGDAFAAGFLYAMHEGWSIAQALRLAHATAAASLRSTTTTGAVETWQKCLELAERWGWRD